MLPLAAVTTPTTVPELVEAMQRGFQEHGLTPRLIEGRGESLSALQEFRVDLTDVRLDRAFRPPSLQGPGDHLAETANFELVGAPIYFEKTPLEVRLTATGVKAGMAIADGRGALVVISAASGEVSVRVAHSALEALLNSSAKELAAQQGFEVKKTSLTFTQEGPRAVAFRAEVTAKVFIMSATLALTGRLVIDDALNARLSNLALDGDAMILKLAGSFARPHIDRLEGRVFPLLAFTPGGLKLRDVQVTAGDALDVRAQFGTA